MKKNSCSKYLSFKFPIFLLFGVILLSGCAQKVKIKVLEPAQIDRASYTKKIAITKFKNDRAGLANKIEIDLSRQIIDNKSFFTIISRKDLKNILAEQKVQNSGLIDTSTVVDVGKLIGAEAIISGSVEKLGRKDTKYYEKRTRCLDKKCEKKQEYKVACKKRVYELLAELRMVDVTLGDIIYADTISKSAQWSKCSDNNNKIASNKEASKYLADLIASSFTYKMTPHYRYFSVVLLDEPDLDYDEKQERLLDVSLTYIKQNRYDKAEQILVDLINSTAKQSYVPFYNLGIIKEAQGKYKEAQSYYMQADKLMIEPVKEISEAYIRIQKVIKKHNLSTQQLQR